MSEAVRHARILAEQVVGLKGLSEPEMVQYAEEERVPLGLVRQTAALGRLPVVTFAAGGIATPADAALMMHLGMDGVFVGSGIFKSENPAARAEAIVQAVTHYDDAKRLAKVSHGLGPAMQGIPSAAIGAQERFAGRGN